MIRIDHQLTAAALVPAIDRVFELSGKKIALIQKHWDSTKGTPVFTVAGRYTSRGWTEWTQGFQFGSAILQFDATGDAAIARARPARARSSTWRRHVSHIGVHDHGFNNVSTYGNLLRLAARGPAARRSVARTTSTSWR